MAIRLKREGRKRYLETDTIADWVEALSMGLPIKGPPAFAKLFGPCRTTSMTSTLSRKSWPGLTNGARRSSPRKRTARR